MKLTLKNVGNLGNATIELNGITVIAGENNTGKSTVGKALYCVFNSFYKLKSQIDNTRTSLLAKTLLDAFDEDHDDYSLRSFSLATTIIKDKERFLKRPTIQNIRELMTSFAEPIDEISIIDVDNKDIQHDSTIDENYPDLVLTDEFLNSVLDKIVEILQVPEKSIFLRILQKKIDVEFMGQINNAFSINEEGEINLTIKDKTAKIKFLNNKVDFIDNLLDLKTQVIYLDDPFILDDIGPINRRRLFYSVNRDLNNLTHRDYLKMTLTQNKNSDDVEAAIKELIVDAKMQHILDKINTVCDGEMKLISSSSFGYAHENQSQPIRIENISTGLKSFVVLKTLLLKGDLESNGTIVLDEPEVHLHPEWQLIFAELIVLLQVEFNMHILLNTHSPYFLNAIEVYSQKYCISSKCKYYLSISNNGISSIEDVTSDTEKIYSKLARPFQILEKERINNEQHCD